jgi:hypothetical protein
MQLFHHNSTGGFLLLPECVKCDTSLLHSTPNVRKKERRGEEHRLIVGERGECLGELQVQIGRRLVSTLAVFQKNED